MPTKNLCRPTSIMFYAVLEILYCNFFPFYMQIFTATFIKYEHGAKCKCNVKNML